MLGGAMRDGVSQEAKMATGGTTAYRSTPPRTERFQLIFMLARDSPPSRDQNMLIGYARVSTQDHNLELQREALTKAGDQGL